MKNLLSLLALTFSINLSAQVPLTGSFTDCNNITKGIQSTLGTGKAIIIAHKGVDCSICISQAPSLQTWAAQNRNKVEVWTALTWKYNPMTFSNACNSTNAWVTRYAWNDIFTFPDNQRQFISSSTPRYYVYSPVDSSIAYNGTNRNTAYSTALQLSTVGIEDNLLKQKVSFLLRGKELLVDNSLGQMVELNIYSTNGSLLKKGIVISQSSVDLSNLNTGVVLIQFRTSTSVYTQKVLLQD